MARNGRRNADEVLLAALAAGETVRQAAERAGVSERTAYRRLADPACRRRMLELRGEMVDRACGSLSNGMADAAAVLRVLSLKAKSENVKLGAARSILELGTRLRESVELEARLAALEARQMGGQR